VQKFDQQQETRNRIAGNTSIHRKVTIECVSCTHIATLTGVTHDSCVKEYKSKPNKNAFQCLDIDNNYNEMKEIYGLAKDIEPCILRDTHSVRLVILDALQHENIAQLNLKGVYICRNLRKALKNKYNRKLQKQHQILQSYTLDDMATYVNDDRSDKNSFCSILTADDNIYEQTAEYEIYEQTADNNDNEFDEVKNVSKEVQQDKISNIAKKRKRSFANLLQKEIIASENQKPYDQLHEKRRAEKQQDIVQKIMAIADCMKIDIKRNDTFFRKCNDLFDDIKAEITMWCKISPTCNEPDNEKEFGNDDDEENENVKQLSATLWLACENATYHKIKKNEKIFQC